MHTLLFQIPIYRKSFPDFQIEQNNLEEGNRKKLMLSCANDSEYVERQLKKIESKTWLFYSGSKIKDKFSIRIKLRFRQFFE